MTESDWVSVASRLPGDGQVVLVKGKFDSTEHRVKFITKPVPRWESERAISALNVYAYWRPLPTLD